MRPSLLVVVVPGVGREDLCGVRTPWLAERLACAGSAARLHGTPGIAPVDELEGGHLVEELHRLGLVVDRRAWLLRPTWQGDDAALRLLEARHGRGADVTFLHLKDVARAAVQHGPRTVGYLAALEALEGRIQRALTLLRRGGEPPQLALLALGPLRAAQRSFDPRRLLGRVPEARCWRRSARPRLDLAPHRLRVLCSSWPQVAALARALASAPFANHGRVLGVAEAAALGLRLRPSELWFVPHRGVALGAAGQRAVPPLVRLAPDDSGCALLPWLRGVVFDLDLAAARSGLLAHVRARAQALGKLDSSALPELDAATTLPLELEDVEPAVTAAPEPSQVEAE